MAPVDPGVELGVVGDRGPDPDDHGVGRRPPVMRPGPALFAGDPLRVAGAGRDLPVERHRRLEEHPRPTSPGVLAELLVGQAGPADEISVGDQDLDAVVTEDTQTPSGGLLGRIVTRVDHPADAGRDDRLGARRCLAGGAARLE